MRLTLVMAGLILLPSAAAAQGRAEMGVRVAIVEASVVARAGECAACGYELTGSALSGALVGLRQDVGGSARPTGGDADWWVTGRSGVPRSAAQVASGRKGTTTMVVVLP